MSVGIESDRLRKPAGAILLIAVASTGIPLKRLSSRWSDAGIPGCDRSAEEIRAGCTIMERSGCGCRDGCSVARAVAIL